ncbi:MAG: MarR family transcriptional regulator [Haloarculaceae archaeon]
MVDVLENKRAATKFRILVEIADRQPAVSQGEIAEAVGVTSQAVSEYIRALVEEGLVEKEARSRYCVTEEGVDWLIQSATDVRRYADHVTDDVLGSVQEDAAIAAAPIEEGETVTLTVRDGLLHATPGDAGPATGVATTDADAGDVAGVTGFEGVIELDPGAVSVFLVQPVRSGSIDQSVGARLADASGDADVVTATGVEAVVALRKGGVEPDATFAAGDVAADAASRGLAAVVVATTDEAGRVTAPLRDAGLAYEVVNL